jgi:hypothetical protein
VQFLVSLFIGSLPVLLRPEGFTEVKVTEPAHEGLAYGVQLAKRRIPHLKYGDGGGNDVPYFPATIEGVYNGKPTILRILGYLEQLPVISRLGAGPKFLNIFNGNYEHDDESMGLSSVRGETHLFYIFSMPR